MSDTAPMVEHLGRPAIDVAETPETVYGPRSPVWCGNTLLMLIESTTLLLLIVSYFYLRQNFDTWPPPNPFALPTIYRPVPDLPLPTIELVAMVACCGVMFWTNGVARELRTKQTQIGLWIMFALTAAFVAARFADFHGTHVRWNDNAYASLVWTILGTHLTYLLAAGAEFFIMAVYIHVHPLDDHGAHDINLTGIYWYWVVATWIVVYVLVYFGARLL